MFHSHDKKRCIVPRRGYRPQIPKLSYTISVPVAEKIKRFMNIASDYARFGRRAGRRGHGSVRRDWFPQRLTAPTMLLKGPAPKFSPIPQSVSRADMIVKVKSPAPAGNALLEPRSVNLPPLAAARIAWADEVWSTASPMSVPRTRALAAAEAMSEVGADVSPSRRPLSRKGTGRNRAFCGRRPGVAGPRRHSRAALPA